VGDFDFPLRLGKVFTFLGHYVAYAASSLPKFWGSLSDSPKSWRWAWQAAAKRQ